MCKGHWTCIELIQRKWERVWHLQGWLLYIQHRCALWMQRQHLHAAWCLSDPPVERRRASREFKSRWEKAAAFRESEMCERKDNSSISIHLYIYNPHWALRSVHELHCSTRYSIAWLEISCFLSSEVAVLFCLLYYQVCQSHWEVSMKNHIV